MDDIIRIICNKTKLPKYTVIKVLKAFAEIQNADYKIRQENDEQSPIAILQEWINAKDEM